MNTIIHHVKSTAHERPQTNSQTQSTWPTHTHRDHISEQCISHQMEQSQMKKIDCMILEHKYF